MRIIADFAKLNTIRNSQLSYSYVFMRLKR